MAFFNDSISRREALRRTVLFSTALMAGGRQVVAAPEVKMGGLQLLALGDYGSKNDAQRAVAKGLAAYAQGLPQPLDGVLALGDNFYGKMTPDRWARDFEQMYPAAALPCPFHVCLGNHDYENAAYGRKPEPRKAEVQLDYARAHPQSRWKLPAKWYALELPNAEAPLLKIFVLDSNIQPGALTPQEKLEQQRWLTAEMAKGTKAPWQWLMWHHPVITQTTKRTDNAALLRVVDEALRTHPFSLVISGHDHNLQHLRMKPYAASFIISGAGGAPRYDVTASERGFAQNELGFNHFQVTAERFEGRFVSAAGQCLHRFRRYPDGRLEVLDGAAV